MGYCPCNGFAAQFPSNFDDAFEGRSNLDLSNGAILDSSAFDSRYCILCLNKDSGTTEPAEMLMWSLYAKHSAGVRLVLEVPDGVVWPVAVVGFDVEYTNTVSKTSAEDFQALLMSSSGFGPDEVDAIRKLYGAKPKCWYWENEYRLVAKNIVDGNVTSQDYEPPLSDGRKKVYFMKFLKQYIVGVDFGLRVDVRRACQDIEKLNLSRNLIFRFAKSFRDEKRFSYMRM